MYHRLKKNVQNKANIFTILLTLIFHTVWGQIELIVDFRINDQVTRTNDFKFSMLTDNDTIDVFRSMLNTELTKNKIENSIGQKSLTGLFEYREEKSDWKSVRYEFCVDPDGLKRIEINLYFSINNSQTEFLQDFSV